MMPSCHHRPVWFSTMKMSAKPRSASRKTNRPCSDRGGSGPGASLRASARLESITDAVGVVMAVVVSSPRQLIPGRPVPVACPSSHLRRLVPAAPLVSRRREGPPADCASVRSVMASRDQLGRQSHPAVAAAVAALTPSTDALQGLVRAFRVAMDAGLAGRPSSLKMLPAFVEQPRGDEGGRVVVVDWGGTNGRVSVIELGGGDARVVAEDDFAFGESDRSGPAARVFDAIAGGVERAVRGEAGPLPLGLVYSFPARLERIDRAVALSLTKGWRTVGLEGHDVAGLLRAAL